MHLLFGFWWVRSQGNQPVDPRGSHPTGYDSNTVIGVCRPTTPTIHLRDQLSFCTRCVRTRDPHATVIWSLTWRRFLVCQLGIHRSSSWQDCSVWECTAGDKVQKDKRITYGIGKKGMTWAGIDYLNPVISQTHVVKGVCGDDKSERNVKEKEWGKIAKRKEQQQQQIWERRQMGFGGLVGWKEQSLKLSTDSVSRGKSTKPALP